MLQNLLIARVELRDETSSDIVPYINQRKLDIILVPLSNELMEYKERYIFIMDRHVKVLIQNNILYGQAANITKGKVNCSVLYFDSIVIVTEKSLDIIFHHL